ncbi:Developmental regulator, ULTRAPETALA [Heracleum sosnowskyi]|uniref:Developmental regulator, ULTRAPETALA n=1 Tax=Heracleum sosnowskyi TaxID=360622 RepID=A0AAD8N876_9APIA|nr:Developmental regulator, ULTRAPETALA [Heracleum sosnowskyi]
MEISGVAARELMFSEEEVKDISGFKIISEGDYAEVTCGCTSHQYGDAVGTLRVYLNGVLEIKCDCTPGCDEDKLSPAAFEKHSGRETARKWKNHIWVIANGEKVPLVKTALLKYYNRALKNANRSQTGRVSHHDEFLRCTVCGKERRFRLRNKEECRAYHDALRNVNWKCSDPPSARVQCSHEEERASRRVYKGCSRSQTCKGCTSCVCFGCNICRFADCSCQSCVDFTRNEKN